MQQTGDARQFRSGLIFLAIGSGALWQLPAHVGTLTDMGPGYFPMLLGICLVLLGIVSVVQGIRSAEQVRVDRLPIAPLIFIMLGVLLFATLVTRTGLAVSLLAAVLASCYGRLLKHPLEVTAIYAVLLPLTWAIFIYGIQLPISLL